LCIDAFDGHYENWHTKHPKNLSGLVLDI